MRGSPTYILFTINHENVKSMREGVREGVREGGEEKGEVEVQERQQRNRSNVVEGTVNIKDVEADETGQKTIDI